MRLNSSRKKKESEKKAVDTCRTLLVRKNATIHNLRGFKDTLSQIINIGFVIDDGETVQEYIEDTAEEKEKHNDIENEENFEEALSDFWNM